VDVSDELPVLLTKADELPVLLTEVDELPVLLTKVDEKREAELISPYSDDVQAADAHAVLGEKL
jgi:hypothetical protein